MHTNICRVVARMCMETTSIKGITLPPGVAVMADVWTLHYDKNIWGSYDPNTFEPDR